MLIPSGITGVYSVIPSLSRRVNANSQHVQHIISVSGKLIKKGEC